MGEHRHEETGQYVGQGPKAAPLRKRKKTCKSDAMRIEAGTSRISPDDLRPWGLAGYVAWSILSFAETTCRDRGAKLDLLKAAAEDIIAKVLMRSDSAQI